MVTFCTACQTVLLLPSVLHAKTVLLLPSRVVRFVTEYRQERVTAAEGTITTPSAPTAQFLNHSRAIYVCSRRGWPLSSGIASLKHPSEYYKRVPGGCSVFWERRDVPRQYRTDSYTHNRITSILTSSRRNRPHILYIHLGDSEIYPACPLPTSETRGCTQDIP